ncbi:MAG: hypothetical protein R6V10_17155 [bacterium]
MRKGEAKKSGLMKAFGLILAVLLAAGLGGCGSDYDDDSDISPLSYLALANTDYDAGQAAKIKVDENGSFPAVQNSTTLDADPGGMHITNKTGQETVFLAGRQTSTIYKLDPDQGMNVRDSYTIGPGTWATNPQDILVVSKSKAYVTRYANAYDDLLIIDPRDGSTKGTIDFTGIPTNGDTLARPADMVEAGNTVFVAIQNLDTFGDSCDDTVQPGFIAVINPATDSIADTITLNKSNPSRLYYDKARHEILVASAGYYNFCPGVPHTQSSGLEAVSASFPYAHYVVVSGDDPDINGNIYDVALAGEENAYVLVAYGFNFEDRARKVDLAGGSVDSGFRYPATNSGNDALSGIQVAEGFLFIGDRTNSGVEVIRTSDDKEVGFQALDLSPMIMRAKVK